MVRTAVADGPAAAILPGPIHADVLAGPLALHDGRFGVLLLLARPRAVFEPQHVELMQVLLEPFAAALENDRHVAEMAALREAAEADKRSLLKRLGRDKLGRYDRRRRLGTSRGHGTRRVGLQVRRARAHLRRDRIGQGGRRPGDPQRLAPWRSGRSSA